MNKGPIAAVFLIFGFMLHFAAIFLSAAEQSDSPAALLIAVLSILLWMSGSFVLTAHLQLHLAWGFAGLLSIVGIYLMFRAAPGNVRGSIFTDSHRESEERKANTYDF